MEYSAVYDAQPSAFTRCGNIQLALRRRSFAGLTIFWTMLVQCTSHDSLVSTTIEGGQAWLSRVSGARATTWTMTTTTVPTPHRTPLRRLSQGSLFRLSRSGVYPDAPHGLGFLEPALGELLDEMEALQANVAGLKNLSDALETFNESFSSWLYVMNMNALTTDWPQAPTPLSFKYAAQRAGMCECTVMLSHVS